VYKQQNINYLNESKQDEKNDGISFFIDSGSNRSTSTKICID
jgi:hypothetical protein